MKKLYLITFSLFISTLSFAQVGIGTVTPQKELHLAGTNSTLRIEKLDAINGALYNDGVKPAPAFVDGNGDIIIGTSSGAPYDEPINFLIIVDNFVEDNPYNYNVPGQVNETGIVLNNGVGESSVVGQFATVPFHVPAQALIEVKYGITLYAKGEDMSAHPPPFFDATYGVAIGMAAFFCIDMDNNGVIDGAEYNKKYGIKGQYYETMFGGISGYPYMNGQAYFSLPEGDYALHFYGVIEDHEYLYTSVGFGGKEDYLKIRIYN